MPKPSRTGVQGLYRDGDGRLRIDLRWVDPKTGPQRYKEVLPLGLPNAAAKQRGQQILTLAQTGQLARTERDAPRSLKGAFERYLGWVRVQLGAGAHADRE